MAEISQAKVVILATHGFEQSELSVPQKMRDAGAQVVVVSPEKGRDPRLEAQGLGRERHGRQDPRRSACRGLRRDRAARRTDQSRSAARQRASTATHSRLSRCGQDRRGRVTRHGC